MVTGFGCNLEPHSALSACYLRLLSEHQPAYAASSTNRGSGLQIAVPLICDYYKLKGAGVLHSKTMMTMDILKTRRQLLCGVGSVSVSYYFLNVAFLKTLFIIYYLFYFRWKCIK